jgi:hypothetical protein
MALHMHAVWSAVAQEQGCGARCRRSVRGWLDKHAFVTCSLLTLQGVGCPGDSVCAAIPCGVDVYIWNT